MRRLLFHCLLMQAKNSGLLDALECSGLTCFDTYIFSSPTGFHPVGKFFYIFSKNFSENFKIWPFPIGIESERGNKPASRCMRGGENS